MLTTKHSDRLPPKNALVRKSNKLVEASYDLTLQQLRLIHWLSRAVQEDDEDFKYYDIDVPLFLQFLHLTGSNSSRDRIREVTQKLQEKTILIRSQENDSEWEQFSWLRYSKVFKKDNRLVLRLSINPEMLPYIRDLRAAFTKTPFYQITAFSSRYGWRVYEWCKQFESTGWLYITVDELRSRLQIGETEYARFNNLRQRVITPALAEICRVSDLDVTLAETIKKGRNVYALRFKIKRKAVHILPTSTSTDEASEENLITERLISYGMPPKEAQTNIKKFYEYDREHLLNCLADLENKIETGFPFENDKPLIWLRYILKNDQRKQSTLFVNSANRPTPEQKAEIAKRRKAKTRIQYLESTLEAVARQYTQNRNEFVRAAIAKLPDALCKTWRDEFIAGLPSNFRSLVKGDNLWVHKLYRKEVDAFLEEQDITPLTYQAYCQSIGIEPIEILTEIDSLKEISS